MQFRIKNSKSISSDELIRILHKAAKLYSEYVDANLLFIFRENRSAVYDYYEARFGKNNFMHLAGIKSKTLTACDFFDACLDKTITKEDCAPRKDLNTMYSKVAIIEQLVDLKNSKCYKIGAKDLVTRDNDFEMATGNSNGIIGYDSRVTKRGSHQVDFDKAPIPTTLLNNPITDYCTKPQKIMFILKKNDSHDLYHEIFYEIKNGLFQKEKPLFPDTLNSLIK